MEDIVAVVEDVMTNYSQCDTNAYKESTWGKKVDGAFIIDGYKFKGRQPFRKAKEKLEKLMIKGRQSEINGLEFTVLDAREKGIEIAHACHQPCLTPGSTLGCTRAAGTA